MLALALAVLLLASSVRSSSSSSSSEIRALDAPAVAELVGAAPRAAVLFYAPWCKYSQAFLPHFDALHAGAHGLDGIALGRLDVSQDDDSAALAKQMQVQSYPTLVLFRHGVPTKYSGEYSAEDVGPDRHFTLSQSFPHTNLISRCGLGVGGPAKHGRVSCATDRHGAAGGRIPGGRSLCSLSGSLSLSASVSVSVSVSLCL
jgi:thiol-disulfide isomerase/thioredoxin|eukprot:COSAG03_NODE_3510_length_1975_cov_8.165778_1_plen_202_part_00